MIEISSRKRRKGIMNETDSKRQETMENDIDQVCYNDLDKDERDDCIAETKGIQSFKTKKKANVCMIYICMHVCMYVCMYMVILEYMVISGYQ